MNHLPSLPCSAGYLPLLGHMLSLLKQLLGLAKQLHANTLPLGEEPQLLPTTTQPEATNAESSPQRKRHMSASESLPAEDSSSDCVLS